MNIRPKRRDDRDRRRARSFASSFASLEVRSMLSAVLTSGGTIEFGSTFVGPVAQPIEFKTTTATAGDGYFAHLQDGANRPPPPPGYATSPPQADPDGGGPNGPRGHGRVEFDNASITLNGTPTREFAFANQATGKVTVVVGQQSYSIGGFAQPRALALKDINGDGVPDLIIADSGNDRILVFPGLANGSFGPEANDGSGFAVGAEPSGITVGDVNDDGLPDLIIANSGSNNVSILASQRVAGAWTLGPQSIVGPGPQSSSQPGVQASPVKTVLADLNGDGVLDLLVLEATADAVAIYRGEGGGNFGPLPERVFDVGSEPTDMFIGHFDHRSGLDLVTVNSGSNDITFLSGIETDNPSTLTITSGGTRPDAAVPVDLAHDGTLDLVVANGGDGRVALLQAGNVGMSLAGVISRADLPSPTAIAAGSETSNGFDLYAATAGQDAAAILHFDLGTASNFLAVPLAGLSPVTEADADLIAQLLPTGDSPMDLAAILVNGLDESELMIEHGPGSKSALFTKTEGQGLDDEAPNQATTTTTSGATEVKPRATPGPEDPTSWARFVLGLDAALSPPGATFEAVAESDAIEMRGDRPSDSLARFHPLEARPGADLEAFDAALQSLWSDAEVSTAPAPESPMVPPLPSGAFLGPDSAEPPTADEAHSEMIPLISGLLLASRLILKATPPRAPKIRRSRGPSIVRRFS